MWKIQLFKLNYDQREVQAAAAVIEGGWLTMGENVKSFEAEFANMLGVDANQPVQCLAVTNCTAALHMAILIAGVGPGDEVIIPALTFVADANVVRMAGAQPVLADCVSASDLNIAADDIERKITPMTKAVVVMHFAGYACDMDPIVALCKRHRLVLIEDVAHAPGGTYRGRALGTLGDIGCFSFFSNKNLSIGEGGMLTTRNPEIAKKLGYLRSHGMTTLTLDRHEGRAYTYDVAQPGMNCRMDEIHAALGRVQLQKLAEGNRVRGELTRRYRDGLAGSNVAMPFGDGQHARDAASSKSSYHILPVILPGSVDRLKVMQRMKANGIQTSVHYPPFWSFEAYKELGSASTPRAASIVLRELTLPLYPTMTGEEVDVVVESLLAACTN